MNFNKDYFNDNKVHGNIQKINWKNILKSWIQNKVLKFICKFLWNRGYETLHEYNMRQNIQTDRKW